MFFAYTSDIADGQGEDSGTKFTRFLIAEVLCHVNDQSLSQEVWSPTNVKLLSENFKDF